MNDKINLPEGVGPHEFRELELMLAGEKPMAMFIDEDPGVFIIPEDDFEPHVQAGTFIKWEAIYQKPDDPFAARYIFYALPKEEWRIEKLHTINQAIYSGERKATDEDLAETGRLLGYSEEQVRVFLQWVCRARSKQEGA